jgi:hypothetical protein
LRGLREKFAIYVMTGKSTAISISDVFISYSRKDKGFVERLHTALQAQGRETWVDWDAIKWTEDWWSAIERGIEGTNTFVFVISPDSIESKHCREEIDHAVKHNKRLVPVVYREVEAALVHNALGKLNLNLISHRYGSTLQLGFANLSCLPVLASTSPRCLPFLSYFSTVP